MSVGMTCLGRDNKAHKVWLQQYLECDGQSSRVQGGAGGVQRGAPKGQPRSCHRCASQLDASRHALCSTTCTLVIMTLNCQAFQKQLLPSRDCLITWLGENDNKIIAKC